MLLLLLLPLPLDSHPAPRWRIASPVRSPTQNGGQICGTRHGECVTQILFMT
jgi:hypothetical protein